MEKRSTNDERTIDDKMAGTTLHDRAQNSPAFILPDLKYICPVEVGKWIPEINVPLMINNMSNDYQ